MADSPNALIAKALIAREFPDFDCATLPADIPEFMIAQPWHNEACPSWRTEGDQLELWIDFADPAQREFPEAEGRFLVQTRFEGADDRHTILYYGDDWEAAKAALLRQQDPATFWAAKLGLGFHPDTRGEEYVSADLVSQERAPLFSEDEAKAYDADMERAFALGDPYDVALKEWARLGLITPEEAA